MAIDFGYTKLKSTAINLSNADDTLNNYLLDKEPSFASCIQCGTCSATCSSGHFTEFNLRRVILQIKRGDHNQLDTYIRQCMLCGKCQLACPKGVNTRNLLLTINRYFYDRTI